MVALLAPDRAYEELEEAVAGAFSPDELMELGQLAVTIVVARTKRGIDADGKTFKAYSPAYLLERQRASLRTTPVDLAVKGHMLGGMVPSVTGTNEVTVGFVSATEAIKAAAHTDGVDRSVSTRGRKGGAHQRRMHLPKRDFLDVRLPAEIDLVAEAASEMMAEKAGG
jgi:hypothetical protein